MSTQDYASANASYRWIILAVTYLGFLSFSVILQTIPPVLNLIIDDLHLSHAEAGLLMSLFALPGVVLAVPMGMLVDRYGPRNLIVLCMVSLIAGSLLVAFGQSFPILLLGRMIAGAGGVGLFGAGAQIVSQWFAGREQGMAIGLYSTGMPVGTVVSLNTMGVIAKNIGWQGSVLVGVAVAASGLLLFASFYKPPSVASHRPVHQSTNSPVLTMLTIGRLIWLLGALWMLFNATVISFLTFGPDFFASQGYTTELAGFLSSVLLLASPPLAPCVGFLLDKFGREELLMGIGGLLLAYAIFSIASSSTLAVHLFVALGLGGVLVPTPVFATPAKILRSQYLGTGFGILTACSHLGMFIGPYLSGLARDVTTSYQFSFYLMALSAACVSLMAVVFGMMRRDSIQG